MSPIAFIVCGPPGVGKSAKFNKMLENAGITKKIPLFNADLRSEETVKERSQRNLEEVNLAINSGIDFAYMGTCGSNKRLGNIVKHMKSNKYHVILTIVYTSLPVALERIRKRIDQPVKEEDTQEMYAYFKTNAEGYMKLPVDIYLYNNETDFNLLLSKKNKRIVCRDRDSDFYFDVSRYCS